MGKLLSPAFYWRMEIHCQKKISRHISDDLEISSDNSDEEASDESHEKAYGKERLNIK